MKQTVFTIAIVLVIVGLLTAVIIGSRGKKADTQATQPSTETGSSVTSTPDNQVPIFFYGNTCPHCEDVEKWMQENNIEEKIKLVKKEVYDNRANSLELSRAAQSCGMDTASIGVPFLYTPEGKCLVGTPDIINYLSKKVGMSDGNQATESGKGAGL